MAEIPKTAITGLILAGGLGRRMRGQDKGLLPFRGKPLVEQITQRLAPQVGALLINANRNLTRYQALGYPVISDRLPGFLGPLAGVLTGLQAIQTPYLLTVPCDVPDLPADLAEKLSQALQTQNALLSVAWDGKRFHPVFSLLHRALLPDLQTYFAGGGRRMGDWQRRHDPASADFSLRPGSLRNLNRAADWAALGEQ